MSKKHIALVLGNGESRRHLDLENYSDYTCIGCNATHRDFSVDHLVCCDQRMVRESLASEKHLSIYTRSKYFRDFRKLQKQKSVHLLPDLPYQGSSKADKAEHWGSGPYAVLLACALGFEKIYMVGFDLYGLDHKVNNMYKNTDHYLRDSSPAVDPTFWIYQIKKILSIFQDRQFTIYNNKDWTAPDSWKQPHVLFSEYKNLEVSCSAHKYAV